MAYIYSRYPGIQLEDNVDLRKKVSYFLELSAEALKWAEENI